MSEVYKTPRQFIYKRECGTQPSQQVRVCVMWYVPYTSQSLSPCNTWIRRTLPYKLLQYDLISRSLVIGSRLPKQQRTLGNPVFQLKKLVAVQQAYSILQYTIVYGIVCTIQAYYSIYCSILQYTNTIVYAIVYYDIQYSILQYISYYGIVLQYSTVQKS